MSGGMLLSLIGVLFVTLLIGGMWVPFAIGVGAVAYLLQLGGPDALRSMGLVSWSSMNSFTLTAIPLFILMAEILEGSGLGHRAYRGMARIVVRLPGGLLQTNIAGCAVFAAVSGSSVATAAAIGSVALPQLQERNYDRRMSLGSLAAGGTLGILIPPSIAMIVYATFTESSVSALYIAAVIPGVLMMLVFMAYIGVRCVMTPSLAPQERQQMSARDWLNTAEDLVPFAVLILIVLGSLYFGIATPTEAAAIGTVIAVVIGKIWGKLDVKIVRRALRNTVRSSGSVLFIVLAAYILLYAIALGGLPKQFATWVGSLGLSYAAFLLAVVIMYYILGCLVESMAMMVLTVPLIYPVLLLYGIDPVWFGIILVLLVEIGQISPPFGINLFVIQSLSKCKFEDVVVGTIPYQVLMLAMILLLAIWPQIVTWLPKQMAGL
jgi:C4-dicarboxylate transporter DctM subunit